MILVCMMPEGRAVVGVANQIFSGGLWSNLNICKLCQQKLIRAKSFVRLKSHYAVLGVTDKATQKEIREAYIELSKKEHPDQNSEDKKSHDRFVKINEAYNVLSKESSRLEYDNLLKNRRGPYKPGYPPGYSSQGFSQPGSSQYGQTSDFYDHHQRFYGNSRQQGYSNFRDGYEEYYNNDSPFGPNYEKRRAKAEEVSTTDKGLDFFKLVFKSCAAILMAGFLYESLQILSAYLKHRKYTWLRDLFAYFQLISLVLIAALSTLDMYRVRKKREFQKEFKKRNPTYVTQASVDNQRSMAGGDQTGQQVTRAIKLD